MFEFYSDCSFLTEQNSSWITYLIQLAPILIAFIALIVAYYNFKAFRQTNSVQTHLNLINIENDIRKNNTILRMITKEYNDSTSVSSQQQLNESEISRLSLEKVNSFELYISSVDKLASLISTDYLKSQFDKRDWKAEYHELFKEAKDIFDGESSLIFGKKNMIQNLKQILDDWNESKE